jgi:hypothetical protein
VVPVISGLIDNSLELALGSELELLQPLQPSHLAG